MSKKQIILHIDTTNSQQTLIEVRHNGIRHNYREITDPVTKSQNVLPLSEKALKKQELTLRDIKAIEVNPGPGSYTGTRVGVAVANALGWVLGVPVNGKKIELPKYAESKFD